MSSRFFVRYNINGNQFEAETDVEHLDQVQRREMFFFSLVADPGAAIQRVLPMPAEKETPLLDQSNGASKGSNGEIISQQKPLDLCELYRTKDPKGQHDQILVIGFYLQDICGQPGFTSTDVKHCFTQLRRKAVSEPANITARMQELIERKFLYKPDDNERNFALTDQGIEYVRQMNLQ